MLKIFQLSMVLIFILSLSTFGQQLKTPRPSPEATVIQFVGVTEVKIDYSSPGVKGRKIWGELVPFGEIWRTGANEATTITFSDAVKINGNELPAGTYGTHTIPNENEWEFIFSKDTKVDGSSNFDKEKEVLRVKAKPEEHHFMERMTFLFADVTDNSASVNLLRRLLVCVGLVVLADLLVVSHYVIRTGEVWELAGFRAEAMSAREQTAAFSTAIDDLKKRIGSMNEVNQRLRVMLGIEVPKTGDKANGRGGEEVPISEVGGTIPGGNEQSLPSGASKQMSDGTQDHSSDVGLVSSPNTLLAVASVKEGLEWLSKQATVQERILDELSQAAEQRSSRSASTPSIWPVKGWVTSGFGPRISPFTEKPAWHDGLDIGAAPNTPVRAPAQGRITSIAYDPKLGNMVRVDHGFGVETLYGHLAKALVKEGQRVDRGDVIALVGSSGLSTGPHLHYMVKLNGQALDPTKYILE